MTNRERINALLRKQPFEGLSWTTLVDGYTLGLLPEELRGNGGIDFYKHLGCDVLLLDGWGTQHIFHSPERHWPEGVEERWRFEGDTTLRELITPKGTLTSAHRLAHPVKYPVDSLESLRLYRELWEGASYVARNDTRVLSALDGLIGEAGVVTRFWGPSTLPLLLETEIGTEQFYYLLNDYPDEMEGLIETIHEKHREAFRLLAEGPVEVLTLCENTSTYYISPEVYRKYNLPHVEEFCSIAHEAGKVALVHMCGHVRDLLHDFKQTGMDGIHALTPPPVGNTPWEEALDVLGEDLLIVGVMDPATFCMAPVNSLPAALEALYTPRLREANFCLWLGADGLPIAQERFEAVKHWMEAQG